MGLLSLKTNVKKDAQKKVLLRLPGDIASIIEIMAHQRVRSFNNQIIALIKLGLVNDKEESQALSDADELITRFISKEK
jgi:hypothetical protein